MNQRIPKSAHDVLGRQAAPKEHPSADLLNGFVEQGLSAAEKQQVTAHLATCAECREVVFLAGGAAVAPEPAILDQPLPVAASRWSFWNWKWIVPAVAAVAIAAGVTLMREGTSYPRTTASSSIAINAPPAAPSPQVNEELSDKDAQTRRDAVGESKSAAQPEKELAKKSGPAAEQKQKLDAVAQLPRVTSPQGAPVPEGEVAQLKARDEKDSLHPRALPSFTTTAAAPPAVNLPQKNEAPKTAAKATPSAGLPPLSTPPSAAGSSANALRKSKAAASEVGGGPSETAAARQNQQAVQQQKTTIDSVAVGGSSPDAGSLIEGKPLSVRFSDWRITGDGHLERGSSSGEWTRVLADQPGYIQTVAQVGSDVWAGTDDGTLFHSSDGGDNWTKLRVSPDEHRSIVSIRFRTASEGTVTTDLNTTWKTSDGGKTWSKQ
jgi:hypothetical protein